MHNVVLIATGGTIASRATDNGRRAVVTGAELLVGTRTPDGVSASVVEAAVKGSFAWTASDLVGLLRRIADALAGEVDGVVVTHGTDTMEEVAFLAALAHDDPRPVVFTGAQRPSDDPAADGPANLADALAVAASRRARGRGVLVCFDGHVYPARGVTKVDTLGAHAFAAPGRGPVLRVADGEVIALTTPDAPPKPLIRLDDLAGSDGPDGPALPRVDVVPCYVGTDAALLEAAVAAGARGVVLCAFGAGNANPTLVEAVRGVVTEGVPVLVCTRVPAGPALPLYGGGGGTDLAEAGAIFGGDLSAWQGRMLLAAALIHPDPSTTLRDWLNTV